MPKENGSKQRYKCDSLVLILISGETNLAYTMSPRRIRIHCQSIFISKCYNFYKEIILITNVKIIMLIMIQFLNI